VNGTSVPAATSLGRPSQAGLAAQHARRDAARNILFVDDDTILLDSLERALHQFRPGWRVSKASSAEQAMAQVRGVPQDVIVLDLNMPGISGMELLGSLRELEGGRETPFVVLTGMGERNLKRKALEAGAADLLSKPVETEDLLARLESLLRLKDAQDRLKALNAGLEQEVARRTRSLERSRIEILWRLAKAGEWRDEETGQHVARVAECSRILARRLGQPEDWAEMLFLSSPLHDIGKIGISDTILLKPSRLDEEERQIMQRHCVIGHEILLQAPVGLQSSRIGERASLDSDDEANPLLRMAAVIALSHHERWDGKGYPQGLRGEGIPLEARIVGLTDTFDALCSPRPYKRAYPLKRVMEVMREESRGHFDPNVYQAFQEGLEELLGVQRQYSDEFCIAG
jgi:putative two-component system response regulator